MKLRWLPTGLVLLTAAAVGAVATQRAAETPVPDRGEKSAPSPGADAERSAASRPAAVAGLRVVRNPSTGEIVDRPTAEELARRGSLQGPRRRAEELETFDLPSGARGVVLDDWADHSLRVERTADGSLRTVCSRGDIHGEER